jgi:hypothetical protein
VTISRAKTIGGQGRHDKDIFNAAADDGGFYVHTEIQLPQDERSSIASFRTIACIGKERVFEIQTERE